MTWDPNYKWANPAANWQKTYQSSSWYQPRAQMTQMPQQQNPYQGQMQQQMPQFSQQQLNSFFNFMQRKPISSFMNDPRYQPVPYTNTWKAGEFVPQQDNNKPYRFGNIKSVMDPYFSNSRTPVVSGTGRLGYVT
jgi:hypothetical protein